MTTATAATTDAQPRVRTRSLGCGSGASNAPSKAAPAANRLIRHGSADVEYDVTTTIVAHASTVAHTARATATSPNEAGIKHFETCGNRSRHPDSAIPTCARPGCVEGKRGRDKQNHSTPRCLTVTTAQNAAVIRGRAWCDFTGDSVAPSVVTHTTNEACQAMDGVLKPSIQTGKVGPAADRTKAESG